MSPAHNVMLPPRYHQLSAAATTIPANSVRISGFDAKKHTSSAMRTTSRAQFSALTCSGMLLEPRMEDVMLRSTHIKWKPSRWSQRQCRQRRPLHHALPRRGLYSCEGDSFLPRTTVAPAADIPQEASRPLLRDGRIHALLDQQLLLDIVLRTTPSRSRWCTTQPTALSSAMVALCSCPPWWRGVVPCAEATTPTVSTSSCPADHRAGACRAFDCGIAGPVILPQGHQVPLPRGCRLGLAGERWRPASQVSTSFARRVSASEELAAL